MNKLNFIFLILTALISTICAHTFYPIDAFGNAADYDSLAAGVTLATGEIALPKTDGSAMEAVACSSKADLKAALEADTLVGGTSNGLKHGSCCINAHHVVCRKMQDAIRSCAHSGKGDTSTSSDAAVCPQ